MPVFTPITTLEVISSVFAFVINSYLGLTVLVKNPKSWTNRLFAILALVLNLYIIVNPPSLHPPLATPENQLFWIRIVIFVASFIGPMLFLLVHTFPDNKIRLSKLYLALTLAIMFITAAASLTTFIFENITYPGGSPTPSPGPGMILFAVDLVGFILLSCLMLIRKYKRATGAERVSLQYLRFGVLATFILMSISTVFLVVVFRTPAGVFLGPIFPVILMSAIAYAILKHRFLDIQPVIARAVSFLVLIAIFAIVYAFFIFSIVKGILDIQISSAAFAVFLALTLVAMLTFQPIQSNIKRLTNRVFFKGQYDRDELLSRLTHIMAGTIDLEELTSRIASTIASEMNLSKVAFLIIEDHRISALEGFGYDQALSSEQKLEMLFHNPFVSGRTVIFDELTEGELKDMFRGYDLSIAIPVKVEAKEVAILVAGSKLSGEPYFARDMDLLDVVASESGIAIQNAKAFAEIKNFSKELEGRVEERTRELKDTQERELAKAREVNRLKDEFVFIAAHELRTPVTAIRGFLELVTPAIKGFPKDIQHHLSSIALASGNLNQLINDLLQTSRSDSGELKVEVGPINIVEIIEDVIKETEALAFEKKIIVDVKLAKQLPRVLADAGKVKEIVVNLVSNAFKYNRDGGRVTLTVIQEGDALITEVSDTGYGIPEEDQEKIFQKFSRVVTKETQGVLGTGLGLFISRMLVEKMGGKITFSSVLGKGSTFAFSLPLKLK